MDLFEPLMTIQEGYESLSKGNMNTALHYKRKTTSEINNLFLFFNRMVQQLKKNTDFLEQYKKAIDVSSIVYHTDISGNILYFNDTLLSVSLFKKEEVIGANIIDLFHKKFSPDSIQNILKNLQEKNIWKGEIHYKQKTG